MDIVIVAWQIESISQRHHDHDIISRLHHGNHGLSVYLYMTCCTCHDHGWCSCQTYVTAKAGCHWCQFDLMESSKMSLTPHVQQLLVQVIPNQWSCFCKQSAKSAQNQAVEKLLIFGAHASAIVYSTLGVKPISIAQNTVFEIFEVSTAFLHSVNLMCVD